MTRTEQAERRKAIADAVRNGKTPAVVARRFGVAMGTVYLACQEHAVNVPSTFGQTARADRNAKIVAALKAGTTLPGLCRRFKIGASAVYDVIRAEGLTIPSDYDPSARAKCHPFEVLAQLKTGRSNVQVGRDCGLMVARINQIKQRARKLGLL